MKNQIVRVLEKLMSHFGPSVFTEPAKFRGAILDERIEPYGRKIRFLLTLAICDMNVYTRLANRTVESLVEEMHKEYEINEEAAKTVIGSIAFLHGIKETPSVIAEKSPKREKSRKSETEKKVIKKIPKEIKEVKETTRVKESGEKAKEPPPAKPTKGVPKVIEISQLEKKGIFMGGYKWKILNVNKNNEALIITVDIINKLAYHNRRMNITWEYCDVRKYLNNSFYEKFSKREKDAIITQKVQNDFNEKWFTQGGAVTLDKMFLLSIAEAGKFFKNNADRISRLQKEPTWWWLRSPGAKGDHAAFVYASGNISLDGEVSVYTYSDHTGMRFFSYRVGGIRPAMVVDLEKVENF